MKQWLISRNGRRSLWLFAVCATLLLFCHPAMAQEAAVVGTVTDATGAVVSNAKITLTSQDTGLATTVMSAADGQYIAPSVLIGHYTVKVTAAGFKASQKTGVVLNVGDRLRLDFTLQVGALVQTVTVAADAVHLQTETGAVSSVISGRQITQLETNGRSIYTLINLTPGASSLQADSQAPTPVGGDANVSFNGQRMSHNIYLLDGGEDLDRGGGGTFSVMPSLESLGEFRVFTSNYSPQYGLSSAATVVTTIKSGSKHFHGSAWEYFRNNALDARNYFNRAPAKVAELRSNIFGFNIGGPVSFHPNSTVPKTFFFYNMEWRRLIQGQTLNQQVPLPSTYGGNFNGSGTDIAVPCANQLSSAQQTRFTDAGITSFSTSNTDGSCNDDVQFPNDQIPAALLDANAQSLLNDGKIFPAPTSGAYFQGGASVPTNVQEEIVRVDHKFNSKFSVYGHWISEQIAQNFGTTMWSGDNVPTIGNSFGNPSYSAVIHTTYMISPSLLNEAAFNYNGNRIHILPAAGFGATLAAPQSFTFNRIFTGPNAASLMPTINLSNTGTQYSANWTPWNNKADDYELRDDLSWSRGAHQFKFGASWALYKKIQDAFAAPQGNFGFNGFYTGNDFADFLLGYSNSYSEDAVHDSGHWNNVSWAAYANDDWHATSSLTLNLGLRWDGVPHTYEANHRASNFYPTLYNPADAATFDSNGNICSSASDAGCTAASPGLGTSPNEILKGYQFYLNGIGIGGENGIPNGTVPDEWNAWGPRIGFSYDVSGHSSTVIRGGFGVMYERIQGNDMYDDATNVPFDATVNFSNVLMDDPHTSVATGNTLSVPIVVPSITGIASNDYKLPATYQYSAGMEHQFGTNTILSLAYVGNQTRHQSDFRETNLPDPSALAGLISSGGTGYNQMVPYLGYRSIKMAENESDGHYNSLQIDFHTRVHDLQAQLGYTLSRAIDPSTGGGNGFDLDPVSNPYEGWRYDLGPSVFDRTNIVFVNYIYDVPLFRNSPNAVLKSLLGGWQITGISTFESGAPLNVTLGGNAGSNGVQNGTNRPDFTGKVTYPKQTLTNGNLQWFSGSGFSAPALGAWGNLGHDALRGPGRDNWNLALHKVFRFTEHSQFEFKAEAFNVWNHTQFQGDVQNGGIGTNYSGSNFGVITSAWDPRVLQLAGKISF
ncbi:MAG TPA: carboxypeptidase regulatory-like domain-containing protein [Terracidiphilus sp.]|nr:carboxypeptidase regulatory-like domain-containing protein [Terracidiphilus sp.]